jgi:DNA anti-recombination protein RmuC
MKVLLNDVALAVCAKFEFSQPLEEVRELVLDECRTVADRTRALRARVGELEQEVFTLREKLRIEEEALRNKKEVMEIGLRNAREEFEVREEGLRREARQAAQSLERENFTLLEQIRLLQEEVQLRS